MSSLYSSLDDFVVIADVRHLYPVGSIDFFPIDKTGRFFYEEDLDQKIYLFSIKNVEEIKILTKMYCEDFSLNYFIFSKKRKLDSNEYRKYFNFFNKSKSEFEKLILELDLYITFGANAEYMGIMYKKEFFERLINPVLSKFQIMFGC